MKAIDRSLIEKAGYDNGFEITEEGDLSIVKLSSSLHRIKAEVREGTHEDTYILRFSPNLNISELKRNLSPLRKEKSMLYLCICTERAKERNKKGCGQRSRRS